MNTSFHKTILALHGDEGRKWLDELPQKIKTFEEKWSIHVGEPFHLSYNYAAPGVDKDGKEVVLKIGFSRDVESFSEITALEIFDGNGAVRVLQAEKENGVVLLERVLPGIPLAKLENDEKATQIAAKVAKKLWRPAQGNASLIHLEKWFEGFGRYKEKFGNTGVLPQKMVDNAERLFENLLHTTQAPMLLHGDFHHHNILSSERDGWLVIDPKGVIGDPIYDLAVFLYNPIPDLLSISHAQEIIAKRIDIFSDELGFEKQRIKDWAYAQAILSALWTIEDNAQASAWEYILQFISILEEIK